MMLPETVQLVLAGDLLVFCGCGARSIKGVDACDSVSVKTGRQSRPGDSQDQASVNLETGIIDSHVGLIAGKGERTHHHHVISRIFAIGIFRRWEMIHTRMLERQHEVNRDIQCVRRPRS